MEKLEKSYSVTFKQIVNEQRIITGGTYPLFIFITSVLMILTCERVIISRSVQKPHVKIRAKATCKKFFIKVLQHFLQKCYNKLHKEKEKCNVKTY